jgi:hypothetical protein
MFRQSLIAATLALATIAASTGDGNAAAATNGTPVKTTAVHHPVVVHRTIVRYVYRYEPAPAPYYGDAYYGYYGPTYAPAPPIPALPAAAACVALSLIGGC